jgi:nucleoside-diphosphate-sugar epimerase
LRVPDLTFALAINVNLPALLPGRWSALGKRSAEMKFRVLIIGGTGQVGAAVVRALAAEPSCAEVVMVNRRAISEAADPRVRTVVLDTAAAQFPAEVTKLAQSMIAQGDPVYGRPALASVKAAWSGARRN